MMVERRAAAQASAKHERRRAGMSAANVGAIYNNIIIYLLNYIRSMDLIQYRGSAIYYLLFLGWDIKLRSLVKYLIGTALSLSLLNAPYDHARLLFVFFLSVKFKV